MGRCEMTAFYFYYLQFSIFTKFQQGYSQDPWWCIQTFIQCMLKYCKTNAAIKANIPKMPLNKKENHKTVLESYRKQTMAQS